MADQTPKQSPLNKKQHSLYSFFRKAKNHTINRNENAMRQALKQLRSECERGRNEGVNPLEMFPREIWKMISEHLDYSLDFINWTRSCTLFAQLTSLSPVELLFAKVIPMISSKLTQQDILACRLVCQPWKKATDECILKFWDTKIYGENSENIKNSVEKLRVESPKYTADENEKEKFEARFRMPLHIDDINNFQVMFFWHGFLSVEFQIRNPNLLQDYKKDLVKVGSSVRHLEIEDSYHPKNDDEEQDQEEPTKITANDFSLLCQQSLEACPILKNFTVFNSEVVNWNSDTQTRIPSFPPQPFLEMLSFSIVNESSSFILDELLNSYAVQLKYLEIIYWNGYLNHTLNWSNLKKLIIKTVRSNQVLQSLARTNAPNLLALELSLKVIVTLEEVLKVVQNFTNLRSLILACSGTQFDLWANETVKVPTNLAASVKTLQLFTKVQKTNFDFLVCFPVMRELVLYEIDVDNESAQPSSVEPAPTTKNFIRITEYLTTDSTTNAFYSSNLWALFPMLDEIYVPDRTFTRDRYNWNLLTSSEKLQQLLKILHNQGKQRGKWMCNEKLTEMKGQFYKRRYPSPEEASTTTASMTPNVLEILLQILDKLTILNCRLVCKFWKNAIDAIVSKNPHPNFTHVFVLPFKENEETIIKRRLELMNQHNGNPLVGKSVNICLSGPEDSVFYLKLCSNFLTLLQQLEQHVHHLQLTSQDNNMLSIGTLEVLVTFLQGFKNLQSLDLRSLKISGAPRLTDPLRRPTVHLLPNFTTFWAGRHPPCFDVIQYEILNQHEGQLETLQLSSRRNAHNRKLSYDMPNLKEFGMTEDVFEEYPTHIKVHGVTSWQFFIDSALWQHGLYSNHMSIAVNSYPKLKEMELYFSDNCKGVSFHDAKYFDSHEIFKISLLKLVVRNKWQISFDFLLRYPLLEKLVIHLGDWAADWYNLKLADEDAQEQIETEDVDGRRNYVSEQERAQLESINASDKSERENDLIPLAQFIWEHERPKQVGRLNLYDSNIWIVLPRLESLEIVWGRSNHQAKTYKRAVMEYQRQYRN